MKHYVVKYLMVTAICFLCSQQIRAQRIYLTEQPKSDVVTHQAAPSPNYVWIEDEWIPKGRTYVHQPGHWVAPRPHYVWIPGHWVREHRGWYWTKGYWAKE
jgi:hypothetical protein